LEYRGLMDFVAVLLGLQSRERTEQRAQIVDVNLAPAMSRQPLEISSLHFHFRDSGYWSNGGTPSHRGLFRHDRVQPLTQQNRVRTLGLHRALAEAFKLSDALAMFRNQFRDAFSRYHLSVAKD
ncbi:hypothetical protein, partial [Mesorhizobium sp.]|uniref:hypothetical protein n=1 Tax=Mesorhizobium sp. TaxID=1871066 RepID=UPI00261DAE3B